MVDYNPSLPIILGQEWVPIRNQYLTFGENQSSNSEIGTTFSLLASTQVNNARFYLDDFVYGRFVNEGFTASIYPAGREDETGPIKKLVIPCTSGAITGGITFQAPATDVPTALANPGTIRQAGLVFNAVAGFTAFRAQFGVMQQTYAEALAGKRIVGVTVRSQVIIDQSLTVDSDEPMSTTTGVSLEYGIRRIASSAAFLDWELNPVFEMEAGANASDPPRNSDSSRADRLGNFSLYGSTMMTTANTYPWTYEELTKFDSAFGASSVAVQVMGNFLNDNIPLIRFTYMALEVYYCEETRVAFGTTVFDAGPVPLGTEIRYKRGLNVVPLYNLAGATNPVLPAGNYTITMAQTDFGDNFDITDKTNTSVKLNGIRQLYPLPSFDAKEVLLPTVIDDSAVGETLVTQEIVNVPQLSVHLSGGAPLTQVHPYGRQVVAEVWGTKYVQQELLDTPIGSSVQFPWVRFFARRFGDTTIPLTLTGQGGLSGSSTSITPDEFDLLEETLDGWKEVSLQFTTPPSMGLLGTPNWRFTATGELAGNRWEVLGASAPALSGVPGNLFNLAPATQQLYTATYSAPTGDVQDLEWMPQGVGSPYISGAGVTDDSSDLFLIFAQEPPAVSGFSVTTLCQPVTGIGQECEVDPCCIPTSIYFNQISWDAVHNPGLGYSVELQRMDEVDTDWQTIMLQTLNNDSGMVTTNVNLSAAITPDTSSLDILGDLDLRVDATLDAWVSGTPSGATDYLVSKYNTSGNQRAYALRLDSTGGLQFVHSTTGGNSLAISATASLFPVDGRLAVRATLDVDNGASGYTVTFYTAPTIAGPWTQLGSPVVTAGVTTVFSSSASLVVGAIDEGTNGNNPGIYHAAQVYSGIAGTLVANPDFQIQPAGTASFTDSVGLVWTVQSAAEIVNTNAVSFNDFEARVGVITSYRMRNVDLYGFWGDWSDTISALISEPGVSIGCRNDGHVLIFTSNERQSGAINLAYSSVWMDQQVTEDFTFAEAGFVQLQAMYDRDYFTAFRPLERGGEQFSRTVLVQAAAISPPTLGDFRSLRDMAWEAVNYICVRDEDGNRWFATVGVPSGRVLNNRRLYLAPVQVVEVTATPTPVDPADSLVAGVVDGEFCDDFECEEVVAEDSFDRVEVGGWGQADVGGDWDEV